MSLEFFQPGNSNVNVPLYGDGVAAGFPSPAEDYMEQTLDLNELMVNHPTSTFYVRVDGDSMIDAGIYNNDILVVDRSLDPRNGDIIIANVNGEFCVKVLDLTLNYPRLLPQNKNYPIINISVETPFSIFGVVTGMVRKIRWYILLSITEKAYFSIKRTDHHKNADKLRFYSTSER